MLTPITRDEARTAGLKRFFTGEPCRKGHLAERTVCDGFCVACAHDIYLKKIDQKKAQAAQWKRDNPEARRASSRRYYAKHVEEIAAKGKVRRCERKDQETERVRDWRERNADHYLNYQRGWKASNATKVREYSSRRRALKRGADADLTAEQIADRIKLQGGCCAYCQKRKKLTVDHIIPLSRGGQHTARNIQMVCRSCNSRKSAKDPIEFAQSIGLLV